MMPAGRLEVAVLNTLDGGNSQIERIEVKARAGSAQSS